MGFSGSAAPCGAFSISPRPPGACQILDDGLTISYESPRVNTVRAFRPRMVVSRIEVPDQSERHLESFQNLADRGVRFSLTASAKGMGRPAPIAPGVIPDDAAWCGVTWCGAPMAAPDTSGRGGRAPGEAWQVAGSRRAASALAARSFRTGTARRVNGAAPIAASPQCASWRAGRRVDRPGEPAQHVDGVVQADEVLVAEHRMPRGGQRTDLTVGPARPVVSDGLQALEEREEVLRVGRDWS